MASEKSYSSFGRRVLALLDGRPMAELARSAGMSKTTLSSALTGTNPSAETVLAISQAIGCPVEYLMTGKGDQAKLPEAMSMHEAMQYHLKRMAEPAGDNYVPGPSLEEQYRRAQADLEELGALIGCQPTPAAMRALLALSISYGIKPTDLIPLFEAIGSSPDRGPS